MEQDELDGSVLQQFSSMQTIDREELVKEMIRLVGSDVNQAAARFYLEMNQWSVQGAVCSYFDLQSTNCNLPGMVFIRDITIGEGESVPPKTRFVKTWRVQNPGPDAWPPGCILRFVDGAVMSLQDRVGVDPLPPYESTDISVEMESPSANGIFQSQWRMSTATGSFFGETIWVIITVNPTGTLSITQQLSNFNILGSRSVPFSSADINSLGPTSGQSATESVHQTDCEMN